MLTFNTDAGYLEALVRGYKSGLLSTTQYLNLCQCETLADLKLQLQATDYGSFLSNEAVVTTSLLQDKLNEALLIQMEHIRSHSLQPLSTFLDYLSYAYMIDNVILLITGALHERDPKELLSRCHPLGVFESMGALTAATSVSELYNTVLVDSPLASYFEKCLSAQDLDELNIEIIRNTLYKAYLEDFYSYCESLGGPTFEVMRPLLMFEADRRAINITLNSLNTELSKDDRLKLFPTLGLLYPEGLAKLAKADEMDHVRLAVEPYLVFLQLFLTFFFVGIQTFL